MDADGVAAEVIFPDADSITGMESPPFGAGSAAGMIEDPELAFAGRRGRTTASWSSCARRARCGAAASVWCRSRHDVTRAVAEIEWLAGTPGDPRDHDPDDVARSHARTTIPSYDPVWAACEAADLPVHAHSGEAPREEMNDFIGIYLAEVVFWTHRPIAHLLFSGAFERFPGLKFVVTEGASYWVADMKWKWDQYFGGGHTTKKMAALMKGILSKLPSDYFGENIFVGASTMSKEEIRRRHAIGCDAVDVGHGLPASRRYVAEHDRAAAQATSATCPVGDTRQMLGETAARCYGFDVEALRPISEQHRAVTRGSRPGPVARHDGRGHPARGVVEGRVPGAVGRVTA